MARDVELLWTKVKEAAQKYGLRGLVPSEREAEHLVNGFIHEVNVHPRPPKEAANFFVSELIARAQQIADNPTA